MGDYVKEDELDWACSTDAGEEKLRKIWGGRRLEGVRTLGSPRRGWDNNIKMNLKGTGLKWLRVRTSG